MKSRRKAREAALQVLYQCDTLGEWSEESVDFYYQVFHSGLLQNLKGGKKENYEFSRNIVFGTLQYLPFIDEQISAASTRWSISRMARVDRNILRLATYEVGFEDDIPVNVSINEAIEIAKNYGTDDSPMFINGVLDNVASVLSNNPELVRVVRGDAEPTQKIAV